MNILIIIVAVFLLTSAYAGVSAAPWLPTRKKDIERFLKFINLQLETKMYFNKCLSHANFYV